MVILCLVVCFNWFFCFKIDQNNMKTMIDNIFSSVPY